MWVKARQHWRHGGRYATSTCGYCLLSFIVLGVWHWTRGTGMFLFFFLLSPFSVFLTHSFTRYPGENGKWVGSVRRRRLIVGRGVGGKG